MITPNLYHRLLLGAFLLAAAGTLFAQAPASRPQQGPAPQPGTGRGAPATGPRPTSAPTTPPSWWHSDTFRKEIGLTAEGSQRLDRIFQDAVPRLREDYNQLDERENKLSRLIERNADEQAIAAQIDRVEAMRSALNKERQLMLVHMRAVLTPDQRVKFNENWLRWREGQLSPAPRPADSNATPRPSSPGAPAQRPAQPAPSSATTPPK